MTCRAPALVSALAVLFPLGGAAGAAAEGAAATRVFDQPIPNIPGKSLIAVVVDYAPGAKPPAHRHAASAFICAYVLSGAIRSQVDDGPARVYHAGESWSEAPGAHHGISENASAAEPARPLAVLVVDTGDHTLTIPDSK